MQYVNKHDCGEAETLPLRFPCASLARPLRGPPNPRMYGVLTAITPGCVASAAGGAPEPAKVGGFQRFSALFFSRREPRGRQEGGFEPERRSQTLRFQGRRLSGDITRYLDPGGGHVRFEAGASAPTGLQ